MNMSQMRSYIKQQILVLHPDYLEWTGSIEDVGNIPNTQLDRTFHIEIGASSTSNNIDHHIEDVFTVDVALFKRGYNSPVDARDSILQIANCIRMAIINPANIQTYKAANDSNIEQIQNTAITPSAIETSNDNIIKVLLTFNIRLFWTI